MVWRDILFLSARGSIFVILRGLLSAGLRGCCIAVGNEYMVLFPIYLFKRTSSSCRMSGAMLEFDFHMSRSTVGLTLNYNVLLF